MTKDKDEWGNIELPGLSDEELYSTNWNHIAGAQQRINDPGWRENQKKNWSTESAEKRNAIFKEKRKQNPEHYKEIDKIRGEKLKTNAEWRKNVGRYERDETYAVKQRESKGKRVWTKEGIFNCRIEAAEHFNTDPGTFGKWMDSKPTEFYYVDDNGNAIEKTSYNKIKELVTPNETFKNKTQALKSLNISSDALKTLMRKFPDQYYYLKDGPGIPINHNKIHTAFGEFISVPVAHKKALELGLTDVKSAFHWFGICRQTDPNNYFKIK